MKCPACGKRISWVPLPNGRRVAITAQQDPEGSWYLNEKCVLLPYHARQGDVPRYARHFPCLEDA